MILQFVSEGSWYRATVDESNTLMHAEVRVCAHDRNSVWRTVKHPFTLARLQNEVRPPPKCPTCGQPVKGTP